MAAGSKVKYLIVGGGAAAAQGAVGVREVDKEGSVLIVTRESWWPYDRPPLSKSMLLGKTEPADAESKDPSWYEKNDVEVRRGTTVLKVDLHTSTASLDDGSEVVFEKLLLATGASPRRLSVKGVDLPGVHVFRSADDSLAVREAFGSAKNAVLIGAGYIGLEVGSACIEKGLSATIVDPASHPWSRSVSPACGAYLTALYEKAGAKVLMGAEVADFQGEGSVQSVVLKSGESIPCDLAVVGVGVTLNLELAKEAGLKVDDAQGVEADACLQSSHPNVYVAGDIACFEDRVIGRKWHLEHYLNARWQGKQAGRNMAGAGEPYDQVPYFFSDMLDVHMVQRGDPAAGKSAKVLGDMAAGEFVELYAKPDGTIGMGLAFSHEEPKLDPASDRLEKAIREHEQVSKLEASEFGIG